MSKLAHDADFSLGSARVVWRVREIGLCGGQAGRMKGRPRLHRYTVFLSGNIPEKVGKLKQQQGPDLHAYGSASLVQTLNNHG
jgi:hypothetical protein